MLEKKLEEALNDQINFEFYSSYLYLSMSAYYVSAGLNGFANWMRIQAQEEAVHAMKLFDYIGDRGGRALLKTVKGPETEWDSPEKPFEDAYKHETIVSSRFNDLMNLSIECKDHATSSFLRWYVDEQVEEEANALDIVNRLKLVKGAPDGLFMLDKELGLRVFKVPAGAESVLAPASGA